MDHNHVHHDTDADDQFCASPHMMVFHTTVCQEILFDGWKTTTVGHLFGACVAVFVASVAYEGFKYLREYLFAKGASQLTGSSQVNIAKNECGPNAPCSTQKVVRYPIFSSMHCLQTVMHIIQATVSYLLMLVFMTYNVWVCIALIAGLGVGYFLFGWQKQTVVDVTEHCH